MISRKETLQAIERAGRFDLIVIGGGASGIGAAVEAALRGYKTLLLEKHDFTKGTSSKSTKLVHGGVRYMAQGDLKMVREALKERGYLVKNAPHLVHAQPFIIPIYRWWDALLYTVGLTFYDLLAGRYSLGRSAFLGKKKTLEELPGISHEKLKGGVRYYDGQFDDSRLAMDLLHVLNEHGGLALNYAKVTGISKDDAGKANGVEFILTGNAYSAEAASGSKNSAAPEYKNASGEKRDPHEQFTVEASAIMNATGVWVDEIMKMDQPGHRKTIRPSQGIHLVLPMEFLPREHALMIPKTSDGRVLFAVPWHDHLVVGTTDTPVDVPSAEPVALEEEVQFILDTATKYLEKPVNRKDVLAVFAGLRPLAAPKDNQSKTKEISRNHKILISDSNLITIIGGKWTTYRKMAQDMVDTAIRRKLLNPSVSISKDYRISGEGGNETGLVEPGEGGNEARLREPGERENAGDDAGPGDRGKGGNDARPGNPREGGNDTRPGNPREGGNDAGSGDRGNDKGVGTDERDVAGRLSIYGKHRSEIEALMAKEKELAEKIHPALPYTFAEAVWCAKNESVEHLEDLLSRRLRAILLNSGAAVEASKKVAEKIAPVLGWEAQHVDSEIAAFKELAKSYQL